MNQKKQRRLALASLILATATTGVSADVAAQGVCGAPAYSVQRETVLRPQVVQRYRLQPQTEYVEKEVVSFRPVTKTRYEERSYRVAKPIVETSMREEVYSVLKPIVETSMREETVQTTRMVEETREREETVTTFKPVVETQMYQRQYQVNRPVTETSYYDQTYAVNRPVTETVMQNQTVTTMRPVTTTQQQVVDAGGYVAETSVTPGQLQYQSAYVPRTHAVLGPLGLLAYPRGSYTQVPTVSQPQVQTQLSYRPNYITQQTQQTQLVPQTQQVQVPVQVNRIQTEYQTQRVPVQQTRFQSETITQNVPVQTTRMVPTTEVRRIPYMVTRPVTETSTRKVPVQQTRYVREEKVRKVPVQTTRMTYETRSEKVAVNYTENERVVRKVLTPVQSQVCVPYEETVMVPTQISSRVPFAYNDPFSPAIVSGYSSIGSGETVIDSGYSSGYPYDSSIESIETSSSNRVAPDSAVVQPDGEDTNDDEAELRGAATFDTEPKTKMETIRSQFESESIDSGGSGNGLDNEDMQELLPPRLDSEGSPFGQDKDSVGVSAGHRINWRPQFSREI